MKQANKEMTICLVVGLTLGLIAFFTPFTRFIFSPLTTLVHELGHAFFGWIYGYPSIPAFDFTYGGGVTMGMQRKIEITYVTYGILLYGLYYLRQNIIPLICNIVFLILFIFTSRNEWADIMRIYMGHGTELLIAAIFLYRGFSGSQTVNGIERSLYFSCAFFIFAQNIDFAYQLQNNSEFLADYMQGKGDITHDFHALCLDHFYKKQIKDVAFFHYFSVFFAAVIGIGFAALRAYLLDNEFDEEEE
ncbi:hypothetical protein PQO03_11660 [Lentisphaera profundi]|uniref:Peptidase M50 domain-containing protein n=1 Tax=Lentisphaera profundi TaxID=1658616 RepID=A0ABY7VZ10_9BACT|nr:hypothetical protein [Lentisphaera profundi]WDE98498.1 hypothetical protein PQO03_11660 [Lentisphaera profundi]